MSRALQDALGFGPVPERRLAWRKRWLSRWPYHVARVASNVLASVAFLVLFLPLPVKLLGWLTGFLAAFAWWMVVALMAGGLFLEWVTSKIDRWAIRGVMKTERSSSPLDPPRPFPTLDKPLCCPTCRQIVSPSMPLRGYFACRCGTLLLLKEGEIDLAL